MCYCGVTKIFNFIQTDVNIVLGKTEKNLQMLIYTKHKKIKILVLV